MTDHKDFERRVKVRRLALSDFASVVALQEQCFPKMPPWTHDQFESMVSTFPEGQICVELEGEIVASSSSLMLDFDLYSDWHDWGKISDRGYIRNHDPKGNTLYGIEIMVHPAHRGLRLARRLYEARKELCREKNLERLVIGGRIPGYQQHQGELSAQEYVDRVEKKALYDPVLTTQLSNGFALLRLIPDYLPSDEDSAGFATHMEWVNLNFLPGEKRGLRPTQIVRVAAVQYEMRRIASFEEFERQVEFFIDAGSDYHADFVLFPELFTLQLLSITPSVRPGLAARKLAEYTPRYLELMSLLAIKYNVNIIGGSSFVVENGKLYNIAYLFRRNGSIERQYKIHVTPGERRWWGVEGGSRIEVFDTDRGRIAISICYDIEFPELARIAAKLGAQILFCPFNTNERAGYLRVRHCAQARCIENHLYVVLAGCIGNLPQVANADIHYAQSAVLTPCDLPFARDGVAGECQPNIETLVIHDVDVELLRRHRYTGATQNFNDRRPDVYQLSYRADDTKIDV
jgi:predicted amidohydrolase/ribosomal protein S18 acetylase RimI-like enzyme